MRPQAHELAVPSFPGIALLPEPETQTNQNVDSACCVPHAEAPAPLPVVRFGEASTNKRIENTHLLFLCSGGKSAQQRHSAKRVRGYIRGRLPLHVGRARERRNECTQSYSETNMLTLTTKTLQNSAGARRTSAIRSFMRRLDMLPVAPVAADPPRPAQNQMRQLPTPAKGTTAKWNWQAVFPSETSLCCKGSCGPSLLARPGKKLPPANGMCPGLADTRCKPLSNMMGGRDSRKLAPHTGLSHCPSACTLVSVLSVFLARIWPIWNGPCSARTTERLSSEPTLPPLPPGFETRAAGDANGAQAKRGQQLGKGGQSCLYTLVFLAVSSPANLNSEALSRALSSKARANRIQVEVLEMRA